MRDLTEAEVKAIAEAASIRILEEDLPLLTVRFNGWMELLQSMEALPLDGVHPIPTLLTQRGGS